MMRAQARRLVPTIGALVCGAIGCGTPGTAVNPDETSAEGHRLQAEREHAAADREVSRHDPAATRIVLPFVYDQSSSVHGAAVFTNPTDSHLTEADARRVHARAHERAAERLERFEAVECKGVPPSERAACPLLAPVVAIRDFREGVRIELAPSASVDRVIADMRCHYAFARTRGFTKEAAACPLYIRGIRIDRSGDGQAIEIRGPTADLAREIRTRVRQEAVFAPQARAH